MKPESNKFSSLTIKTTKNALRNELIPNLCPQAQANQHMITFRLLTVTMSSNDP